MTNYLLDNDVVLKFAQYDLFDQLQELCGGPSYVYVLPTMRFRFHLNDDDKGLRLLQTVDALERIRDFSQSVAEIENTNEDMIAALQDVPQIDAGEAVLFAAALEDDASLTYTGDKRAIVSLFNSAEAQKIVKPLIGRIKCIEQVVAEMLIEFDSEVMVDKVRGQTWDTALRACFSSGIREKIMKGLRSYYDDLNSRCGNFLADFPEPT